MSESTNSLKSLQFTWKITNYSQQKLKNEPGKRIISQAFPGDCEGDLEFTLYFYPQGHVQAGDNEVTNLVKWASLFLHTESSKNYDTFHHFEFSILDADGEKFCIHHFHQNIPFLKRGYHQFIRLADLENPANNLLQNDTLTICCRVEDNESETKECYCLSIRIEAIERLKATATNGPVSVILVSRNTFDCTNGNEIFDTVTATAQ